MEMMSSENQGKVRSLNNIDMKQRLDLQDFVPEFRRKLVFILTSANIMIAFSYRKGEVENITYLKGFKTRLFFLEKSNWIVTVNNRSEVCMLDYRQKLFYTVMKLDLGLVHLERMAEVGPCRLAMLDREGELGFYEIDRRLKTLELINNLKPLENQAINDFLYIPTVICLYF